MTKTTAAALGLKDIALLLMVAFMWGSNNVAAHVVTQEANALVAAGLRFCITTLILLPWLRISRAQLRPMLIIAVLAGPLHFGLIYTGFSLSHNVGALTVVLQMWVPISTALAILLLHEHPTRQQLAGMGLALLGILVMCFDPHLLDDLRAVLFCLGATCCWGITMVLTRRAGVLSGLSIQAWMALLTGPLLLLVGSVQSGQGLAALRSFSPGFWWLTFYAVIGAGVLGNVVVFNMVRRFTVAQTTPVLLTAPLFAMICGYIFVQETFGAQELVGAALMLASVFMIVRGRT